MARNSLAPWAESLSDEDRLMRAEDLARLPDDARGYELVDGRLARMTPTGGDHSLVTSQLDTELRLFVRTHGFGVVLTGEPGFLISQPGEMDTVLAPVVAFVRAERVPPRGSPERGSYWPLAPDLVAEVASPSQYAPELAEKAKRWLAAGARLVGIIWPEAQRVDVWRPGKESPTATLQASDTLDGMDVLPGFTYPVANLFDVL
jgi:Uma2 family endonuclease